MSKRWMVFTIFGFIMTIFIGCSSGSDNNTTNNATNEDSQNTNDEMVNNSDSNSTNDDNSNSVDTGEEKVMAKNDGDGFTIIAGEYLSIPDEFPDDIPIPEQININSTTVGEEGSDIGEEIEIRYSFHDEKGLSKALNMYRDYTENNFEEINEEEIHPIESEEGSVNIEAHKNNQFYQFHVQKYNDDDRTNVAITIRPE